MEMRMKLQREFGDQRRTVRVPLATRRSGGYLMNEMLVYIGVVFMILGVGYAAVYRCIDRAVVLRRNANDIVSALHAGELWRADCRAATAVTAAGGGQGSQMVRVTGSGRSVEYCFTNSA